MTPHTDKSPALGSGLKELFSGMYATGSVPLPFMDGVDLRSYVLQAQQGIVIVYNTPGIDAAADEIRGLGEPTRLLINHWHEEMYGSPDMNVPAYVGERDRVKTEHSVPVAGVFTGREQIGDDLEALPSFSHTAGTTLYLWDNGEHRFLFTGDAIWIEDGMWKAVILGESNRQAFLDTLAMLRDLDFDVLVPWPARTEDPPYDLISPDQKRAQIDNLTDRIKAGASGPRA